jgi:hypothetical protein
MKLQQAYLKKFNPRQHAYSTDGSRRPEDVPYSTLTGRVSAMFRSRLEDFQGVEPAKFEEGIAGITHVPQFGLLN